jgi:hypothetical protein
MLSILDIKAMLASAAALSISMIHDDSFDN